MPSLERHILRKLYRRRCIGAKHTAAENALSGVPAHLRKRAKHALAGLISDGLVRAKPTAYGLQVSLEPARLPEIRRILGV